MEGKAGIYDIAEICRFHGVETAVLCPGSRCAPLTLAFSRTEGIRCLSVVDERSAAFIALGMAETSQRPVVLICTSGTAVLNFAPALAEAYYRHIPLLVLTADRPLRLVGQQDGQTMNQPQVYANYIRQSFHLNGDIGNEVELAFLHRTVNAALIKAKATPAGPVHINISFEEPLYHLAEATQPARTVSLVTRTDELRQVLGQIPTDARWLFVAGSRKSSAAENEWLQRLANSVPVLAEAVSNAQGDMTVANANEVLRFAAPEGKQQLVPEVLVTFGEGIVSKNLKTFLRTHKPKWHIHLDVAGELIDTYHSLTHVCTLPLREALAEWVSFFENLASGTDYLGYWLRFSEAAAARVDEIVPTLPFGDLRAMDFVTRHLPADVLIHVANSMPVRYLNIFSGQLPAGVEVFCNRGTSGIDGSVSTALGNALGSGKPVWVITGDLSFQYDGNALWNGFVPVDLRIIVVNNSGGGIFRLIDGPSSVPELTERFETRTQSTAKHKAAQHGLEYYTCDSETSLREAWDAFAQAGPSAKILEIYTDPLVNETVFKAFQQQLSKTI